MNDVNLFKRHIVEGMHILSHGIGDGDDAVGVLVGCALHPGTGMIGSAELFHLPGAVRF
jgi:hypothetical protein